MTEILRHALPIYIALSVLFFVGMNLTYGVLLWLSMREIMTYMRRSRLQDHRRMLRSEITPSVSIVAPAYNEEATIVTSVRSLLKLAYGNYEVIVINDGSRDGTLATLIREFDLVRSKRVVRPHIPTSPVRGTYRSQHAAYPNLVIVDKENGGKSDALNVGINTSRADLVCCIDADSILEEDAILKVVQPFLGDDRVVAAGGIVRIVNGCEVSNGQVTKVRLPSLMLPLYQVIEYLRAFLSGRMGWQALNGLLIISGAFGMFRRSTLVEVGGFDPTTVGEDMELVVRIHRTYRDRQQPYRIVFLPDPVCWTEVPESTRVLSRQRGRWQRGLQEVLWRHRGMLFRPRYGVVGSAALPHFLFVEFLGPVVEFLGYISLIALYLLGSLDMEMLGLYFIVAVVYGVMFSVGAVLLEEISFRRYPRPMDLALLLAVGVIENLGYRQLTVLWRLKGMLDHLRGRKEWGLMERMGYGRPSQGPEGN